MSDMMSFPTSWEEFIRYYSFLDLREVYTNGKRLVPLFRVKQMMEHYHHEWISVEDRMPKPYVDVLVYGHVYAERNGVDVDYVDKSGDFYYYDKNVTHWMPLPTPPKGE